MIIKLFSFAVARSAPIKGFWISMVFCWLAVNPCALGSAEGEQILVLRVTFADATSEPVSYTATRNLMHNQIEPFYQEMAFGREAISVTVAPVSYALQGDRAFYTNSYGAILQHAKEAASADFDLSSFTDFGVIFPRLSLSWNGRASTGRFWINGSEGFTFKTVAHEIGHTFGLWHANYWRTTDGTPIGPGSSLEYGDPFDIMGHGGTLVGSKAHFSPRSKYRVGWLNDTNAATITSSGTFRLHCFDNPAADLSNFLALRIAPVGAKEYWLGLRGQLLNQPGYTKGLYVTWGYDQWINTHLINMTPGSTLPREAPLQENTTFVDTDNGIEITIGEIQGSGVESYVDVHITISPPARPMVLWGSPTWGQNAHPSVSRGVIDVAVGEHHSLAIIDDGTVVQWGGKHHQIANVPPPEELRDVIRVAAADAGHFSIALSADGRVTHWGAEQGRSIEDERNVIEIAAGHYHCLALRSDGIVGGHGNNEAGQSTVPPDLDNVVAISAGQWHSMALRGDGTVVAWGRNHFGQSNVPPDLADVVAIAALANGSAALKSDGTVVEWGYSPPGATPKPDQLGRIKRIATGSYFILAELEDGGLVSWGAPDYGVDNLPPVPADKIRTFAVGGNNAAIILGSIDEEPFHAWRTRHRISVLEPLDARRNPGGLSLLEEYAFGRDPNASDWRRAPLFIENHEQESRITFRTASYATDVDVQLEVSNNLVDWRPAPAVETGTEENFVLFRSEPLPPADTVFARLRLRLNRD